MKPFDKEAAMRGDEVMLKSKRKAGILLFDGGGPYPLIGWYDVGGIKKPASWSVEGKMFRTANWEGQYDLVMAPKEEVKWIVPELEHGSCRLLSLEPVDVSPRLKLTFIDNKCVKSEVVNE